MYYQCPKCSHDSVTISAEVCVRVMPGETERCPLNGSFEWSREDSTHCNADGCDWNGIVQDLVEFDEEGNPQGGGKSLSYTHELPLLLPELAARLRGTNLSSLVADGLDALIDGRGFDSAHDSAFLLAKHAPELLSLCIHVLACWPEYEQDEPIPGADLVDWFVAFVRQTMLPVMVQATGIERAEIMRIIRERDGGRSAWRLDRIQTSTRPAAWRG